MPFLNVTEQRDAKLAANNEVGNEPRFVRKTLPWGFVILIFAFMIVVVAAVTPKSQPERAAISVRNEFSPISPKAPVQLLVVDI